MLVLESAHQRRIARAQGERVFLLPGQGYFGGRGELLRTLLGSCVALTLWHPARRIGGMCHFLLPTRGSTRPAGAKLDGRYGDEALEILVDAIGRSRTRTEDYQVHLYGGADTMPGEAQMKFNIGERNVDMAWSLVERHGFQLQAIDVGGEDPRHVSLDLATGQVAMRRGGAARAPAPAR